MHQKGYKKIGVHLVYDVKHDGRLKARCVADGHLTQVPAESVYSGVVSLRSLRLCVFLAELNDLELWGADVGNAYLESKTREKNYIVAGPEFGDRQGHILIIYKALYGLRTSGKCFLHKFAESLRAMGFTPSKPDSCLWMRQNEDVYEYVAVYVDDLCIASRNCAAFCQELKDRFGYKLKGDGSLEYHLGNDFERDPDGTLRAGPRKYIQKMISSYEKIFDSLPKEHTSPLEKGDHPELDQSELLDADGITQYQSPDWITPMVGISWAI